VRRREFITLLGGAIAWPLTAGAQQPERMRRIGVLMSTRADDPEGQARIAAFLGGLQQLGWTDGRNVEINTRWATGDAEGRILKGEKPANLPVQATNRQYARRYFVDKILRGAKPADLPMNTVSD
jgi:hypothetical protein